MGRLHKFSIVWLMQGKRTGGKHKIDILDKYLDGQAWLKILAFNSYKEYIFNTDQTKAKTAESFKISFSGIDELTKLETDNFNENQEALLFYYYKYIRNHQSFREWCSLS